MDHDIYLIQIYLIQDKNNSIGHTPNYSLLFFSRFQDLRKFIYIETHQLDMICCVNQNRGEMRDSYYSPMRWGLLSLNSRGFHLALNSVYFMS
ncbi:MAG: hypothetical protein A2075_08930 [Geobacteraceae bacterium GWC2_58_44]|nr:MAG: hypothetical protein A2075_08930 [Geobacteraceae bacterium GWC2_58_44]HBG04074.1 hypothetical protein [Geobacter sp.]